MKQLKVMKFLLICLFSAAASGMLLTAAFAATEKSISVNAEIPQSAPQVSVTILRFTDGDPDQNPWTNSQTVGTMDFGELTYLLSDNSNAGLFYSPAGFCVVISAESFGKPYSIMSSCNGISSGSSYLKSGSFGLVPVYSSTDKWVFSSGSKDQGDMPSGATLGAAGSGVGDKTIYSSESTDATARIIQAYYGLPPYKSGGADPFPGYTPIPLTQAPGQYSGTVVITISLK
ncbi:MAG: hypothetical protein NTY14_01760 [Candidatus Omnitrophica bacterium]|nr:hypothetical protein [Candidatus Omnitrophota bacterium]